MYWGVEAANHFAAVNPPQPLPAHLHFHSPPGRHRPPQATGHAKERCTRGVPRGMRRDGWTAPQRGLAARSRPGGTHNRSITAPRSPLPAAPTHTYSHNCGVRKIGAALHITVLQTTAPCFSKALCTKTVSISLLFLPPSSRDFENPVRTLLPISIH